MAVAAFYTWERLGRPLTPAQPIREFVEKCRVAFPKAAAQNLFSWYADAAHYEDSYPEDHTPFSVTGWPVANPQWWVCATDVMHRPELGVDCAVLVPYWLAEARGGRMPWLKYVIWQAKRYDVRNGWVPVGSSGHFDHAHLSGRTDHLATSLGDWAVTPTENQGDQDMILIVQDGSGATYTYNGVYRVYQGSPDVVAALVGAGVRKIGVPDTTKYGIEFDAAEYYADRDRSRAADAKVIASTDSGGTGDGGLTVAQAEEAAFQGSQRAERE